MYDAEQREGGGDEDDEAVGKDFGEHDFAGGDGHDEEVFDGAVFAFADDRRADEQQQEQQDGVAQRGDGHLVGVFGVGVVAGADDGVHQRCRRRGFEGFAGFLREDLCEVGAADAALVHAGGVDVQEDFWRAVLQEVALEVGGDFEDEDVVAAVHGGICFGAFDGDGRAEVGRADGVGEAAAEGRAVFVDDGDGGVTDVGVAL